ncbi:hypothetical protein SAMN05421640_1535 [Ekhidna lutea]|uniref:Uncharacterized protein n=1 Tax=Ekhidna lutea TaxID=447679 RepID=A0A239HVV8_EKHLU|nr:hypothetical protein SAMN05421640_1535 [Ekhidna lutea]
MDIKVKENALNKHDKAKIKGVLRKFSISFKKITIHAEF